MAGLSATMQQVRSMVEKVARSMAPVLVSGESGTGKELVARAIHEVSTRAPQAFIPVNCSAIPEQLLEAEFFGYRKGAFTGAADDREGFFQAANGGTLFLDEIGDLPLSMQSKLLRAIQERSVRPVGAVAELPVDVRILSATHKDLAAEVQAGQFRQDLYYRLNVIQIRVPPLRERAEDLAIVSERVLERLSREAGVWPAPQLTREALVHLSHYPFPGNVRELENLLHRAVALSGGEFIDVYDLSLPDSVVNGSHERRDRRREGAASATIVEVLQPPVPTPRRCRSRNRCRTTSKSTSIRSSARSSSEPSSSIATTERPRDRASACRCGRSAIGWRASASTSAATLPVPNAIERFVERTMNRRWDGGMAAAGSPVSVAEFQSSDRPALR